MFKSSFFSAALLVCLLPALYPPAGAQTSTNSSSSCENFRDLENSLFSNETNIIALSLTFFPLEDNSPEFVQVTYDFGEGIDQQVWYWSVQTSHFLHPFEVLQFLSLFFNKPEPYYSGSLNISLSPGCADAGFLPGKSEREKPKLQLLTQRVSDS